MHLAARGPKKDDVLYTYLATYVLRNYSEYDRKPWSRWNDQMRDQLIDTQLVKGAEAGSWFEPRDARAKSGGRLYQTALSAMTLEIYYRHLPIYQWAATKDEFKPAPPLKK
jgi:hypothetical protein